MGILSAVPEDGDVGRSDGFNGGVGIGAVTATKKWKKISLAGRQLTNQKAKNGGAFHRVNFSFLRVAIKGFFWAAPQFSPGILCFAPQARGPPEGAKHAL